MNREERLLDAVYEKLKIGEELAIPELNRWIDWLAVAPMHNISTPDEKDVAAINAKLANMLQQKFSGQS